MVCCIVLQSKQKSNRLLLNRRCQEQLESYLESRLAYKPFIFNSVNGVYLFVKRKESFEKMKSLLLSFPNRAEILHLRIFNVTDRPRYFRSVIKRMLRSNEISALGWMRFINSFVLQVNPYHFGTSHHSIKVFEKFRRCVGINGNKYQRKYLKKRLKMLRDRVSLEPIKKILKLD